MSQDLHAGSNRVINAYLNKETPITLTRGEIDFLAYVLRNHLYDNSNKMTTEGRHELAELHTKLVRGY